MLFPVVAAVVMVARFSRVGEFAVEICFQHIVDVALAAAYHAYSMCRKLVESSHAHIAGKHHRDTHLLHHRSNVRLASAALR